MTASRRSVVATFVALSLAGCASQPDYVQFTDAMRDRLLALRKAEKFNPEKSDVRNYPGPDSPDLKAELNQIIDTCLDGILAQPDGRLDGDVVREQFVTAMSKLDHFAPADNDRAVDYMLQTWRILGFKTRTGVLGEPDSAPGSIRRQKNFIELMLAVMTGRN